MQCREIKVNYQVYGVAAVQRVHSSAGAGLHS